VRRRALPLVWLLAILAGTVGSAVAQAPGPAEPEAHQADPRAQIPTLMDLGMAYGETGRWGWAIERFKQVLALDPQFAPAHLGLGRVYFEMKQYPEAETELLETVQIDPGYVDAHFLLSFVKEKLGDTQGAIAHAEQAVQAINARKERVEEEVRAGRLEQDDTKLLERLQQRLSKLRGKGGPQGAGP